MTCALDTRAEEVLNYNLKTPIVECTWRVYLLLISNLQKLQTYSVAGWNICMALL